MIDYMIKAVLIDDERPALRALEYLLKNYKDIEIAGMFTNPLEAINKMTELNPQVVFLDIDMPQLQGMDAASLILDRCPQTDIVFVTAYDHYAVEAFEMHALDYFLKPVSTERFAKSINRILDKNGSMKPLPATKKFRITTLGKFQAGWQGEEAIKLRSEKTRELFAFLLYHAGRQISRDEILEAVWSDVDLPKAVHGLHNGIYYIRKSLQEYGVERNMIKIEGNYLLTLGDVELDSLLFKQNIKAFKEARNNIEALEKAESLYFADYFEDSGWIWAEPERETLRQQYMDAVLGLAEVYMQTAIFDKAEEILLKAYKINPYMEEVSKLLINLYQQTNRKNRAIKHYRVYEKTLQEDLGLAPGDSFEKLLKQI
jgi:two-component SAPR family response regulator